MESFGVLFGRLVRDKRGVESMSQDALAAAAGLTKARISEIETGKIPNPQARTVDALCVALNISPVDRAACHPLKTPRLPARLLTKLTRIFGVEMPEATEDELVAFLSSKAAELQDLQERLQQLGEVEGQIAERIHAAKEALGDGEFGEADRFLQEAEVIHLAANTIVALKRQAQLRVERGNTALVNGEIDVAAQHFEQSAKYFSGVDPALAADQRQECSLLLRYYGYRYKNAAALYAAKVALEANLGVWSRETQLERWCDTKIALGGVGYRLSEFDASENAMSHLIYARNQLEEARTGCSKSFLPKKFATVLINLANVYSNRLLSNTDADSEKNLATALDLQNSALDLLPQAAEPESWGILQHNMALSCIALARLKATDGEAAGLLTDAVRHAERSFEVRDPAESLQYWIASSRTLAEALIAFSGVAAPAEREAARARAVSVLRDADSKISENEHPHQWAQLQQQLARVGANST